MDESKHQGKAHSAETFIPSRDLWWNADFLALFRKRWDLAKVRTVLDVGCGVGHWGRTLAPILSRGTRITGIDPEARWVKKSSSAVDASHCRFDYRVGKAEATGFPDGHFDMVTCQTVLIHVPDPAAALREMWRVLKPGGILALAEPENFAAPALWNSLRDETTTEEYLQELKMAYLIERGKEILGEGNLSVGGKLPALVAALGGTDVRTYTSDRAIPIYPPYREPAQKLIVRERIKRASPADDAFFKKTHLRYFLAAGGDKAEFLAFWRRGKYWEKRFAAQVRDQRFAEGGAAVMYLISSRK
jgi:ubiquinone/menaquinone biosynthesis C-methylase UbiE